jgi:hypothetical protein
MALDIMDIRTAKIHCASQDLFQVGSKSLIYSLFMVALARSLRHGMSFATPVGSTIQTDSCMYSVTTSTCMMYKESFTTAKKISTGSCLTVYMIKSYIK